MVIAGCGWRTYSPSSTGAGHSCLAAAAPVAVSDRREITARFGLGRQFVEQVTNGLTLPRRTAWHQKEARYAEPERHGILNPDGK
jgi:hypothetical protein